MYGKVPPVAAFAVMLPVLFPLQRMLVCDAIVTPSAEAGWVIATEAEAVHPWLSVTVMVYVLAVRLEAVNPFPPLGVQA